MANPTLEEVLEQCADEHQADIFLFNASINNGTADRLIHLLRSQSDSRENCILLLTTYGGDPDAAYRMVRAVKRYYSRLILFVFGYCRSAGTLIALGADHIIMSDFAELGPLDIQLVKDDEWYSGLNYMQSLTILNESMYKFYEQNFDTIKEQSGGTISTKMAAEIASKLAIGIISPISSQIDPVKLGEIQRRMNIARAYGLRLCNNEQEQLIEKLIHNYPSHGFVIDLEEAQELFPSVRDVEGVELWLEVFLLKRLRKQEEEPDIEVLYSTTYVNGKDRTDVEEVETELGSDADVAELN